MNLLEDFETPMEDRVRTKLPNYEFYASKSQKRQVNTALLFNNTSKTGSLEHLNSEALIT